MATTLLTRDAILAVDDLPTADVEVPEWGGCVRIRTMTGAERDNLENSLERARSKPGGLDVTGVKARLAILTMVDMEGEAMFTIADLPALQNKSGGAIDRLFKAAQDLNALGDDAVEELAGE